MSDDYFDYSDYLDGQLNLNLKPQSALTDKAKYLIEEIKSLKNKGSFLSKKEAERLESLQKDLDELQKNCSHFWETYELFRHFSRFCIYCDAEDKNYKHFKEDDDV